MSKFGANNRPPLLISAVAVVVVLLGSFGVSSASSAPRHKHKGKKHSNSSVLASMGRQPSPSIFGIDTAEFDSSAANYAKDFPAARGLGARFDHFTLGSATGSGNFKIIDGQIKAARKRHMGLVLSFGGIAQACSQNTSNAQSCPPTTSADLSTYQGYVKRVLLRYRNVVTYFESWTEPNTSSSWAPGPNPAQYAALLKAEYSVVQSVNSKYGTHLKLLFGSPTNFYLAPTGSTTPVLPFTQSVLDDLQGAKAFDAVALHAYRLPTVGPQSPISDHVDGIPVPSGASGPFPDQGCNSTPQCSMTWTQELSAYEQEFTNHGYGQPDLWLTEFGWPGSNQSVPDVNSEGDQQQYLTQAYQDLLSLSFVKAAMWFNIRDYKPGYTTGDPAYFYYFGLLEYNFANKPAATTFQSLASANPGR